MEPVFFKFFNEIGILAQLSRAAMEEQLPNGMLVSHFSVLNHLIRVGDGPTPLHLSNAFQVPKTTMTHTLSGLEKAKLVEMRPNPHDARSKQVWITDAGKQFREDAIIKVSKEMEELGTQFSIDRVQALLPELEALRKIMDARRD